MSSFNLSGSASASAYGSASASGFGSASLSGSAYASGSASASYASGSASASYAASTRSSGSRSGNKASSNVVSEVERQIINAQQPIAINETEEIEAIGHRGIFANRTELQAWRGKLPLAEYKIYEDPNPQIIRKKNAEKIKYIQNIKIRYLKPPPPGAPGDLVIKQQPDVATTPAPPLVIRKPVDAAKTPEPLIVREAPPCPPPPIPSKTIIVPGKTIPPPPRKVVIEKLPEQPPKPQPIVIERWLPYDGPAKRKVVYEKPCPLRPPSPPKNLIIEWDKPQVEIEKREENLGVVLTDPVEYRRRYQFNKQRSDLPEVVRSIQSNAPAPAAPAKQLPELEGDLAALKLIDLDKEGLSEYKSLLGSISGEPTSSSSGGCGCSAPTPAPAPAPCGCN